MARRKKTSAKRRLGFTPAVHRERTADALYNARAGVTQTNKLLSRQDCKGALKSLVYTARLLGAAHAEKAGARNTGLRRDSFRPLLNLKDKVEACFVRKSQSRYERNNEP